MHKPIVLYTLPVGAEYNPVIGKSMFVYPMNHPSAYVSNQGLVITSAVVKIHDKYGVFETENSIYHPAPPPELAA